MRGPHGALAAPAAASARGANTASAARLCVWKPTPLPGREGLASRLAPATLTTATAFHET